MLVRFRRHYGWFAAERRLVATQLTWPSGKLQKIGKKRTTTKKKRKMQVKNRKPTSISPLDDMSDIRRPLRRQVSFSAPALLAVLALLGVSAKPTSAADRNSISISPRVGQVRLPVESNALLKCLISSNQNKLDKPGRVHWSRLMYDENVYEQLESSSSLDIDEPQLAQSAVQSRLSSKQLASNSLQAGDQLLAGGALNRQQQLREFLARSRQEVHQISESLLEATLSISPIRASDNASYFCALGSNEAKIDLVALSRPVVRLERVQPARDSRSALIYWQILSDGNTPIKRTLLMLKNDTWPAQMGRQRIGLANGAPSGHLVTDSDHNQWQRIDIEADGGQSPPEPLDAPAGDVDVTAAAWPNSSAGLQAALPAGHRSTFIRLPRNQRAFKVNNLLPGVTYSFRVAAINDMGQSEWSYLSATMPNEIPAQISEIFLLGRTNETLSFGWRRPSFDTAKTTRYELQLFDLNRTLTLDANNLINSSSPSSRLNYMYIFVKLNPATDYHFHLRACSRAGCSAYSSPKLLATTEDGEPDEPLDVELICGTETSRTQAQVTWTPPGASRGLLLNYSVEIEGHSRFINQMGVWQEERWKAQLQTSDNHTLNLETEPNWLKPNSNYSTRVCANNRSRYCGRSSQLTPRSKCSTPPELPTEDLAATFELVRIAQDENHELLSLRVPLVSMRNGSLDCIQVVLIRLPSSYPGDKVPATSPLVDYLPRDPSEIRLNSRENVAEGSDKKSIKTEDRAIAYLADEYDLGTWLKNRSAFLGTTSENSAEFITNNASAHSIQIFLGDGKLKQVCRSIVKPTTIRPIDLALHPHTYYTGFLGLYLVDPNNVSNQLMTKFSNYFSPIKTGELVLEFDAPESFELSEDSSLKNSIRQVFNGQLSFNELVKRLQVSLNPTVGKIYNATATYVSKSLHLREVGSFIESSSPAMQLLEIATIVLAMSLLILLLIYIFTLPASRKRHTKQKRTSTLERLSEDEKQTQSQIHLNHPELKDNNNIVQESQQLNGDLMHQASNYQMQQVEYGNAEYIEKEQPHLIHPGYQPHYCATMRRTHEDSDNKQHLEHQQYGTMRLRYTDMIMFYAERIRDPIPLDQFRRVLECRIRNKLLREEYEHLPLPQFKNSNAINSLIEGACFATMHLEPQLIVSRDNGSIRALISGNDRINANIVEMPANIIAEKPAMLSGSGPTKLQRRCICAKSPLDADSVWDFWRLVYEQEVGTIIMLSQVEDPNSHELRCAQYWPTCDNEETTILSPCNEYVQQSSTLPAKFKIRQETISTDGYEDEFRIRNLTLLVMATRADEDEHQDRQVEDEDELVIVERSILHLQYLCWNTGSFKNQSKLIRFIEYANLQQGSSPVLVHCYSGLGRSGVFIAMSQVIEELKVGLRLALMYRKSPACQKMPEINLFQLVSTCRNQRPMLISPFRFYELLYQLTANCIPSFSKDQDLSYISLE